MSIFQTKTLESVKEVSTHSQLKRTLGAFDLLLLGIGAIVGTGVFVITGFTAAEHAGPAVTLSYLIAGLTCMFVALAYTEIASMIPTAGSVYTYSYIAFGEVIAWIVGWIMMLELSLGAATVAAGWSGYIVGILKSGGVILPQAITAVPSNGGIINLPAIFISLFIAFILVLGTKESKKINIILVAVKLLAILMFLVLAVPFFEISHWDEFMPHGFGGVMTGAAVIFFAYTGFGTIACATEECKNPKRDVMIGIIGSLVVSTIVYMLIAAALTGMAHYSVLGVPDPLAHALRLNGSNLGSALVATGAVAGMTTVILAQMYGQSRIFMVMARDGLLPEAFAKVHPKFNSPHISIIVIGLLVAVVSGFTPINQMSSLCSMGALFDYIIVAIIVMMLRVTKPEVERPFKCPLIFLIATIATMLCLWLFAQLVTTSGLAFTLWVLLGLVVYMCYGRKTSKMRIGA